MLKAAEAQAAKELDSKEQQAVEMQVQVPSVLQEEKEHFHVEASSQFIIFAATVSNCNLDDEIDCVTK